MRFLLILLTCVAASGQILPSARRAVAPLFANPDGTPHPTLNDKIVSYWKLDEVTGTRSDSEPTGTPQHLTDNNTVTSGSGVIGNAAMFTFGNNESLSVADSSDLSGQNADFELTLRVKLTTKTASMDIAGKWAQGGFESYDYNIAYDQTLDRFVFRVISPPPGNNIYTTSADTFGSPTVGVWYWIRAVHSAGCCIGIGVNNGSADFVLSDTANGVNDGITSFSIGGRQNGSTQWLNGMVDEVAFWNDHLTEDERTYLFGLNTCCPFIQ